MPDLVNLNEIRIIRANRNEGLNTIRRAVEFTEERAWIYVPKLQIWVYDSVTAESRAVGTNGLLHGALAKAFGQIELVHTHPDIVATEIRAEIKSYQKYSEENFSLTNALPSVPDIMMILQAIDLSKGESDSMYIGRIVHSFGVTTFRVRAFPYTESTTGRATGLYPGMTTWGFVEVLSEPLSPTGKIHKMLRLAEEQSTESVSVMKAILGFDDSNSPRLLLNFTPW